MLGLDTTSLRDLRAGLAVIGAAGSALLTELLPAPPPSPVVRYWRLPYLLRHSDQKRR